MSRNRRKALLSGVLLVLVGTALTGLTGFKSSGGTATGMASEVTPAGGIALSPSSDDGKDRFPGMGMVDDRSGDAGAGSAAGTPGGADIVFANRRTDVDMGRTPVGTAGTPGKAVVRRRLVSAPDGSRSSEGHDGGQAAGTDSFSTVSRDDWTYQAVKEVASEEIPSLEEELDGKKAVTRYELAVILARLMEKIQGAGKVIEGPIAKVAMLEKLSGEFRKELALLGVKQARFSTRLGVLEKRFRKIDGKVGRLEKSADGLTRKTRENGELATDAMAAVEELSRKIRKQNEIIEQGEQRIRKLSSIMSRLLVKVALNDSRIRDLSPARMKDAARSDGALARAVRSLQKKMDSLQADTQLAASRYDSLAARLDRISESMPDRRDGGKTRQVKALVQMVGRLGRQVEENRDFIRKVAARSSRPAISPKALGEVKNLLKDFFNTYERRLSRVERRL